MQKTTILLSIEVRDFLKEQGKKGDSYDDILRRLLVIVTDKMNDADVCHIPN